MIFRANDKYRAFLRTTWIATPPATTLQVTALPANLPTLVTVGWGASYETVFSVTGKSGDNPSNYALTGVTRIKGANTNIPTDATVNCLNHEEFFNQFIPYVSMNFRGDYDPELEYKEGDVVFFEGSSYVAKVVTTSLPTDTDYWILIAQIGASIQSAEFDDDDIVFTLTDDSTVRLENAKLELKGDQGVQGLAATITIGTVTTGAPESEVEVTNTGTETDAILNFTIPEGRVGDQGVPGEQGVPGISIIDPTSLKNATLIEDTTNTDDYEGEIEIDSYFIGLKVNLKVTNANTGSATLNVSSLGAKSIKKNVIDDLEADDIKAGQILPLIYDGTNFQIVGGGGSGGLGSNSFINNETPSGTVDGVNDTFTLNNIPVSGSLALYRDGQLLKEGSDYTLDDDEIVFTNPPEVNSVLLAFYQFSVSASGNADTLDGQHAPVGDIVGTTDTQTLTNKLLESPLFQGLIDGWVSANETWTYASATTITVPSGATNKYQKGDKIKLTQSGSVKYFYIVGVTSTVLTITGGSDYTLANSVITDNYYSKVENPQGFPNSFTHNGTWGGGGSMTYGTLTRNTQRFWIKSNIVYFNAYSQGTTGGSGANHITLTLPVVATGTYYFRGGAIASDDRSSRGGLWWVEPSGSTCNFRKYDASNYSIGATKQAGGQVVYEY